MNCSLASPLMQSYNLAKGQQMSHVKFSPSIISGVLVASFMGVALYLRIVLPYDQLFVGDWIKFAGEDVYYHMRIIDNLLHNFPHAISFDPYLLYPEGSRIIVSLFDYILAGSIWLVSFGAPTQHSIDIVSAYFPAVLGGLVVIPVYFIGKTLFNRWVGVIACGLVGIFPGEFLGRSILTHTDHHVAETLFSTTAILFLILSIKTSKDRGITFDHIWHKQRENITRPAIYSLLAGLFLGIYFLSWVGALLFILIIFVYFVIQFIIDHLNNRTTDYLCFVATITFITTLLISLFMSPNKMSLASLFIATFIPIILAMLSRFMTKRNLRSIFYPTALVGLGLAGLAIFYFVNPVLLKAMIESLNIFIWPMNTTISEMQPFLFPNGDFSFAVAWANFTTGSFLSLISLGILVYFVVKQGEADKTLFVIWSLMILAATLSMRRYAYYFVVNVAILTGYISWLILQFTGFNNTSTVPIQTSTKAKKKAKKKSRQQSGSSITTRHFNMAAGVIIVFFLSFFPNINRAIETASNPVYAPSNAWCESLLWLKDNTPDPFGNPDYYYDLYEHPPQGENYNYPDTAYGITAWWDYGYWITRISHRIPNANPGTAHREEVHFFTAQDEKSANEIVDKRLGSKYVIVDYDVAMVERKFQIAASFSDSNENEFYDVYYQPHGAKADPVILLYPEYYRSLAVRLYNFDGSQVIPQNSIVLSFEERLSRDGKPYKEITGMESFPSYEQAKAYVSNQKSDNYRIGSIDPFASPIPLEALEHYKLIYSSESTIRQTNAGMISEVKIFEYIKE